MKHAKAVAAVILFIISVAGALVAADDRYVSDTEAAQSLSMFDQKINFQLEALKLELLHTEYNLITENYLRAKQYLKKYPMDVEMQEEYTDLKTERKLLKERMRDAS